MLFELSGVRASRGGEPVLDGLDLTLPEGATAVVGPSGSGKSTLLRLLNRLADPEAGEIRFHGEPLASFDVLELRRRVALVPQLPSFLPGTIGENLDYAARLDPRTPVPDQGRLLALAGLDPSFAGRDAAQLSVGEKQRAMLARALAVDPEVLLLDEPTSALDEDARDAIEAALKGLQERTGLSVVLVTHDPAQAARLASHTIRLEAAARGDGAARGRSHGGEPG